MITGMTTAPVYTPDPASPEGRLSGVVANLNEVVQLLHAQGRVVIISEIHRCRPGAMPLPQVRVEVLRPGCVPSPRPESLDV